MPYGRRRHGIFPRNSRDYGVPKRVDRNRPNLQSPLGPQVLLTELFLLPPRTLSSRTRRERERSFTSPEELGSCRGCWWPEPGYYTPFSRPCDSPARLQDYLRTPPCSRHGDKAKYTPPPDPHDYRSLCVMVRRRFPSGHSSQQIKSFCD